MVIKEEFDVCADDGERCRSDGCCGGGRGGENLEGCGEGFDCVEGSAVIRVEDREAVTFVVGMQDLNWETHPADCLEVELVSTIVSRLSNDCEETR